MNIFSTLFSEMNEGNGQTSIDLISCCFEEWKEAFYFQPKESTPTIGDEMNDRVM